MTHVVVFGAFDGVHQGHEYFLEKARALGDKLTVCLARDSIIEELKNKPSKHPEMERKEILTEQASVDAVIYGDRELGTYSVLASLEPDIVAFGYDQTELKRDLENWASANNLKIRTVVIEAFQPDIYKSSLLN